MKKYFILILSLMFLMTSGSVYAGCFNCDDANADATPTSTIDHTYNVSDPKDMATGWAGGENLTLEANAFATGRDLLWFKGHAFADAETILDLSVKTLVLSNGEQDNGGLSFTYASSFAKMEVAGWAYAKGNNLCPQWTDVMLSGKLSSTIEAYSLSENDLGFANAWGTGTTSLEVSGYDSQLDSFDWSFSGADSYSNLDGWAKVGQDIILTSYVNHDGSFATNFGIVTGGWGKAGGDVNMEGIGASGSVAQFGSAQDGMGAIAEGYSSASFEGAGGYISQSRWFGTKAHANGMATVTGYNKVTNTGSSVSVVSRQTGSATTK